MILGVNPGQIFKYRSSLTDSDNSTPNKAKMAAKPGNKLTDCEIDKKKNDRNQ